MLHGVSKKKREIWTQIHGEEGHVVPEAETIHQQYRYDVSVYQGMARIADNHQNLGRNKDSSLAPSEGSQPLILDF